jgi:hypothetical protein
MLSRILGKTAGLLGFWDDNKDKEFLLPNGSFVYTNSSFETIHKEFGEKCELYINFKFIRLN